MLKTDRLTKGQNLILTFSRFELENFGKVVTNTENRVRHLTNKAIEVVI